MARPAGTPGFSTYVLLENPNTRAASVTMEVVTSLGENDTLDLNLAAHSRTTVNMNDIWPEREISTYVGSNNGVGILVERSMYFNNGVYEGGHCVAATPTASTSWYFAEGHSGDGFDEWLLLLNPYYSYTVEVRIDFYFASGSSYSRTYELPPASRSTFKIDDIVGEQDVSMRVTTPVDYPILAERAMYFLYQGAWGGGHDALGSRATSAVWGLAEGYSGPGFDTWVLVENLGNSVSSTAFYILFPDGTHQLYTHDIAAYSRYSLLVDDVAPDREFSVIVESANDQPLVVERSIYFGTEACDGGTCETGYPLAH